MSAIDERVVQMQFDNARFESNIHTSISSLDRLKAALNLGGATKGMEAVENYSNRLTLGGISAAVENISSKFSVMGIIGVTALQNIVNKAVDAGERMVRALSLDQIMAGWNKYADKTTSVQTIMAATAQTWEESAKATGFMGSQMDFVNSQMEKLNWFTDETSYNFTDMVSNIGKFTSNQIPLEEAVTAMQGIANWAAISGQNAGAASRAMYNLSQAIGVGSVKLMDWRSIENANMATAEFKEKVLEVAAANGKLKTEANGTYKTLSGTEVNVKNFSQSLSEGWFDKETLMGVLDQYGSFTNELYEFSETTGLTATEILGLVDAQETGALSLDKLQKVSEETGLSVEDLQTSITSLASEENEFGRKTFKAAQEAKTFQDAIDATKDAASTKWMNIFENIFGDYEEAKTLWTNFAEFLYDVLVSPLEKVEELTAGWKTVGTFERILAGFKNLWTFFNGDGEEIIGVLGHIREAFEEVFPINIAAAVTSFSFKFKKFTSHLKLTEEQGKNITNTFKGIFSIFKIVGNAIKTLWTATAPLRSALGGLASSLLGVTGRLGEWISGLSSADKKTSLFQSIIQGIASAINWLSEKINNFSFSKTFGAAIDWIQEKFEALKTVIKGIDFKNVLGKGLGLGTLGLIGGGAYKLFNMVSLPFNSLKDLADGGKGIIENFKKVLKGVTDTISDFQANTKVDSLKKFAGAIALLAASLFILGLVNYEKAIVGVGIIATIIGVLMDNMESVNKINPAKVGTLAATLIAVAAAFLVFAVALGVLAGALALFTLVARMDGVEEGLAAMFITLTMVVAALYALNKLSPKVIIGAVALLALSASLIVLAGALALFALVAQMQSVWKGFGLMAASLGVLIIALFALSQLGPIVLAGAAAMVIGAAALLVMAGAMAAFAAIAGKEGAWTGVGILAAMLVLLVASLAGLAAVGPMVLVGAAALLVAAAACIALAVAIGIVGLALPLLGMGLEALAEGIANGVIALSGAVAAFGQDLGTAIEGIGSGLGGAIDAIGEGLASAIENIVASVGRGIGDGITAISEGVDKLSTSISGVGSSISEFGNGVRSLSGISWTSTALGIAEFANAIKKVKGAEAIAEVLAGIATAIEEKVSEIMALGEKTGAAFVSGVTRKNSVARVSGTALAANARAGVASSPSWDSLGSNFAQGFINGIDAKKVEAYTKGRELAASAETGIRDESDMASPSKVARKLGAFYGDGFVLGIASKIEDAYDISADMVHATTNALGTAQKLISNVLEDDFTPVITPVLDLSNVSRGLGTIGGLNISSGIYGASTIANSNVGASFNSDYSTDIQTLISLNRELLATAKAGGNVYLDSNVIAGSVNSRLGLL